MIHVDSSLILDGIKVWGLDSRKQPFNSRIRASQNGTERTPSNKVVKCDQVKNILTLLLCCTRKSKGWGEDK